MELKGTEGWFNFSKASPSSVEVCLLLAALLLFPQASHPSSFPRTFEHKVPAAWLDHPSSFSLH